MLSRNISAIISTVIENANLKNAMQYLNSEEQIGFAAVILGCPLTKEELPIIPDNEIAKNVQVLGINPVKDRIEIQYEALKEQKYIDGKWQWVDLENSIVKYSTLNYSTYMKYSKTGYRAD